MHHLKPGPLDQDALLSNENLALWARLFYFRKKVPKIEFFSFFSDGRDTDLAQNADSVSHVGLMMNITFPDKPETR